MTGTRSWQRWGFGAGIVALALVVGGCSTVGYYWQAARGQLAVSWAAAPVDRVIDDPATPEDLRTRLRLARELRDYASRDLGLPDNGSYRQYADLKRPFVVWNVFAAPEFSVLPREWCFPIAGCVSYKGWFDEGRAREFSAEVAHDGYDVFVYGVPAYSTLGWFDDPLLNTFIRWPRAELARLVFHELAHQVAYAAGDSTFNESFATAIELEGVRRWLRQHGTAAELAEFEAMRDRRRDFIALVLRTRARLEAVYAGPEDAAAKRSAKAATFERMRTEYVALREQWGGFRGYDRWFEQPLGNAHLASVATYTQRVPAFERLIVQHGGNLAAVYVEVRRLAKLSQSERDAALDALAPALSDTGRGE
ncbi:MAG: aminopeptidase [Burkholderiales bacterium]|nr:aminopeptidase [Burkholderiales bacterium]